MFQLISEEVRDMPLPHEPGNKANIGGMLPAGEARAKIVLVSLLELGDADRRSAPDGRFGATPVFVTDNPDFSIFVAGRHLYEYFPPIQDQLAHEPGRDWAAYLVRRLRIILDKWRPVTVASMGTDLQAFVEKVRLAHAGYQPPQFVAARHVGMPVTYMVDGSQ